MVTIGGHRPEAPLSYSLGQAAPRCPEHRGRRIKDWGLRERARPVRSLPQVRTHDPALRGAGDTLM